VAEKSNEIIAIPKLLDLLAIEGAIVSVGAMGCQRDIAKKNVLALCWLQEHHDWPGLQGVLMVESRREINGKIEQETRFYLTSLVWLASPTGTCGAGSLECGKQPASGDGHDFSR
jgi:predicted transposase YbfD/YdcC